MKFGREERIITLLVIDTVFFFVEIIVGYAVGSLALVADSFHMLNDVASLIVAFYSLKLATKPSSSANSYGWQRAEILGALINGVFLLALCFSIFMEAIERFFNVTEISNAKLVIIVGSLGLASNIVGLFLFHEHGHSHGGHSHSHDEPASTPHSHHHTHSTSPLLPEPSHARSKSIPPRHSRSDSFGSMFGHPAQTRASVIETAQEFGYGRKEMAFSPTGGDDLEAARPGHGRNRSAGKGLGAVRERGDESVASGSTRVDDTAETDTPKAHDHEHHSHTDATHGHSHSKPNGHTHGEHDHSHDHEDEEAVKEAKAGGAHGHSHGNMNMRGVFLHVLGDALGNVGVILAGTAILVFEGRWKYYFDPAVSLLITVIIFSSALPLVKSASFILLQAVPSTISLERVRTLISGIPGVLSLHELHIWQLSEKTVVASVHVLVDRNYEYMEVAGGIRRVLHGEGVHSSTIQPEFGEEGEEGDQSCLIRCPPETCEGDTCCPPVGKLVDVAEEEHPSYAAVVAGENAV